MREREGHRRARERSTRRRVTHAHTHNSPLSSASTDARAADCVAETSARAASRAVTASVRTELIFFARMGLDLNPLGHQVFFSSLHTRATEPPSHHRTLCRARAPPSNIFGSLSLSPVTRAHTRAVNPPPHGNHSLRIFVLSSRTRPHTRPGGAARPTHTSSRAAACLFLYPRGGWCGSSPPSKRTRSPPGDRSHQNWTGRPNFSLSLSLSLTRPSRRPFPPPRPPTRAQATSGERRGARHRRPRWRRATPRTRPTPRPGLRQSGRTGPGWPAK